PLRSTTLFRAAAQALQVPLVARAPALDGDAASTPPPAPPAARSAAATSVPASPILLPAPAPPAGPEVQRTPAPRPARSWTQSRRRGARPLRSRSAAAPLPRCPTALRRRTARSPCRYPGGGFAVPAR